MGFILRFHASFRVCWSSVGWPVQGATAGLATPLNLLDPSRPPALNVKFSPQTALHELTSNLAQPNIKPTAVLIGPFLGFHV